MLATTHPPPIEQQQRRQQEWWWWLVPLWMMWALTAIPPTNSLPRAFLGDAAVNHPRAVSIPKKNGSSSSSSSSTTIATIATTLATREGSRLSGDGTVVRATRTHAWHTPPRRRRLQASHDSSSSSVTEAPTDGTTTHPQRRRQRRHLWIVVVTLSLVFVVTVVLVVWWDRARRQRRPTTKQGHSPGSVTTGTTAEEASSDTPSPSHTTRANAMPSTPSAAAATSVAKGRLCDHAVLVEELESTYDESDGSSQCLDHDSNNNNNNNNSRHSSSSSFGFRHSLYSYSDDESDGGDSRQSHSGSDERHPDKDGGGDAEENQRGPYRPRTPFPLHEWFHDNDERHLLDSCSSSSNSTASSSNHTPHTSHSPQNSRRSTRRNSYHRRRLLSLHDTRRQKEHRPYEPFDMAEDDHYHGFGDDTTHDRQDAMDIEHGAVRDCAPRPPHYAYDFTGIQSVLAGRSECFCPPPPETTSTRRASRVPVAAPHIVEWAEFHPTKGTTTHGGAWDH